MWLLALISVLLLIGRLEHVLELREDVREVDLLQPLADVGVVEGTKEISERLVGGIRGGKQPVIEENN